MKQNTLAWRADVLIIRCYTYFQSLDASIVLIMGSILKPELYPILAKKITMEKNITKQLQKQPF